MAVSPAIGWFADHLPDPQPQQLGGVVAGSAYEIQHPLAAHITGEPQHGRGVGVGVVALSLAWAANCSSLSP